MFTRTAGIQNRRVISVGYRICYRTHRSVGYYCGTTVRTHKSVGYCIQSCQGILCGVPDLLQNSQKCRVLWCNCHRTHTSIGHCAATVTELTEVVCGVTTDGNYPRYRSVGTLQNLSVDLSISTYSCSSHHGGSTYDKVYLPVHSTSTYCTCSSICTIRRESTREGNVELFSRQK